MLQLTNLVKAAYRSILKNRMRSLLTSLGIIIGVSAVVIMVAIGEGAQMQIERQIASLGTNMIIVFPGSRSSGGARLGAGSYNRLTLDDVEKIRQEATLLTAISPVVFSGGQVIGGVSNWSTAIIGVSPEYIQIRDWPLQEGYFFTEKEMRAKSKVAVLGKVVAEELFPDQSPVGEKIRIRNTPFRVIGVLSEKGQSAYGQDQDDVILAPATTVLYRLKGGTHINMILASAVSTERMETAQEELERMLREAHRLEPGDDDDFRLRNQTEITEAASETSRILTLLLAAVAGVSLVVGGIGIMNIMLVSVTERTREIGIRLAVGARSSDILIQFLIEAVVLSLTGGLFGILFSFGITFLLNELTELYCHINLAVVFIAFGFSGAVGIFFGFYPAHKAAALNPIDALRYE
ncbi:multidrug ABC transporter substrate-binding protein [candidate division KSB1 bacterium 4484_188]|nr:MAG: multidrug ABC transporter substrate-binding protein [candidate division KSB1 bacterium 4484_188]HFE63970.1 FtsX-like permease family protein [Caldithrix sp.]